MAMQRTPSVFPNPMKTDRPTKINYATLSPVSWTAPIAARSALAMGQLPVLVALRGAREPFGPQAELVRMARAGASSMARCLARRNANEPGFVEPLIPPTVEAGSSR